MCGRFVEFMKMEALRPYFPIDQANCEATSNGNLAPGREILAIARPDGANALDQYHWGWSRSGPMTPASGTR
jgi:putative SOS response-associated peptidase YedK